MTVSGFQLRTALVALGIPANVVWEPSDAIYKPCLSSWLLEDFSRWWRVKAAPAVGMDQYSAEDSDCDDATDTHNALAKWAHRRTPEGKGTALPIGRLNLLLNPAGPDFKKHACSWALTSDRGFVFVETQALYSELKLTVPQLNAASRCTD